jgi:iron complex outermembrane receptor protein
MLHKQSSGGSLRLRLAIASSLGIAIASAASAQDAPASGGRNVETVIVTGSYIRTTPEDSALPVDVVTADDLEAQGSPTLVQLVKQLPATSGGSVGESNRYLGNAAGSASVNLRGFGAARTMVLMNGRRMASSSTGTFDAVDINLIPTAAIGSIEVLKDGAAATYGSDAVAGVVNFRTRRDLDGFEVGANYSHIKESDGDYDTSLAWGSKFDSGNVLVTAGFRRRSELETRDVDWAILEGEAGRLQNPTGGWSTATNPGTYITGTAAQLNTGTFGTAFADTGCSELGGVPLAGAAPGCRFHFTHFDNLVNDEFHYQLYSEGNLDLNDSISLHGELMWSRHDVPHERVSPAQSTTQWPTPIPASGGSAGGGSSPYPARPGDQQSQFYIPLANPGLTAFRNANCPAFGAAVCDNLANGVVTSRTQWRPMGIGGNPRFDDRANHQRREADAYRASVGLNGTFGNDIGWDTAITYMRIDSRAQTPDIVVNRLQLALRGLGGPGCSAATGTPGVGPCMWFNPFSNGVATSGYDGRPNPLYLGASNPALVNSPDIINWMGDFRIEDRTSTLVVGDLVFNGKLPFELGGGPVGWAIGGQVREIGDVNDMNDLADIDRTPCVDSADDGVPSCNGGFGPFTFYGAFKEYDISRTIYAGFTEINLPLHERVDATAAVRYEDYGGGIGSTTNPKFSARWQILDWVALRGSAGSTFRAPVLSTVTPGSTRALAQFSLGTLGNLYRPVDTFGNPDLKPETADTVNLGLLFQAGGFTASLDWYKFNFKDELTNENGARLFGTLFPGATGNLCADPAFATLRSRFTFQGGVCSRENFLGIRTNQINGPDVKTQGYDFQAQYRWNDLFGGELAVGFDGNYLTEYKRGNVVSLDGYVIDPATDRAGTLELISQFFAYPEWRGNAFTSFNFGDHGVRVDYRFTSAMKDRNHALARVSPYDQYDLTYRAQLPWDATLIASVQNVTDAKPSFAYSQYNYDYTSANPLGRVFEVGVKVRF